jgi:hypothetical protein
MSHYVLPEAGFGKSTHDELIQPVTVEIAAQTVSRSVWLR